VIARLDDGSPGRSITGARMSEILLLGGLVAAVWLGFLLALQPPFPDRLGPEALPHLSVDPIPTQGVAWSEGDRGPGAAYAAAESVLLTTSIVLLLLVAGVAGLGQMSIAGVVAVARRGEVRLRRALGAPRDRLVLESSQGAARTLVRALLAGALSAVVVGTALMGAWPTGSAVGAPGLAVGLLAAVFASGSLLAWGAFSFGVVVSGEMLPRGPLRRDTPLAEPFRGDLCHPGVPILQIAVASLVVIAAGLLTLGARLDTGSGFAAQGVTGGGSLTLERIVVESPAGEAEALVETILARVKEAKASEGLGAVGVTSPGFWEGMGHVRYAETECGYCFRPGNPPTLAPLKGEMAVHHFVSPDTFRLAGIVLVEGRGFAESDGPDAEPVAVVSRGFARRNFQDGEALGRRVRLGADRERWHTVVGVIEPLSRHLYPSHHQPEEDVLFPVAQVPPRTVEVLAASVLPFLEFDLGPGAVVRERASVGERAEAIRVWLGAYGSLWGSVAVAGVVLALLGTALTVGRRVREESQEIALRRALGAGRLRLLVRQAGFGLRVGLIGTVLGGWAALFLVWDLVPGGFAAGSDLGLLFLGTIAGLAGAASLAAGGAGFMALRGAPREGMEG
jgi:hypothetical protein